MMKYSAYLAECYSNTDLLIYAAAARSQRQKGGKKQWRHQDLCKA